MLPRISKRDAVEPPRVDIAGLAQLAENGREGGLKIPPSLLSRFLVYAQAAERALAEREERIRRLESLAHADELTGLLNRRGLLQFLQRALASARRHRECGVLGYLDLDRFKEINDRYGHEAGDRVLRHVARLIRMSTRMEDAAARIGGDEFVIVLARCSARAGARRLQRLRATIAARPVPLTQMRVRVSASLGIVTFDGESDLDAVLREADRSMYADKRLQARRREEAARRRVS